MASVVVTLHDGKGGTRDLELPGDIPISSLGPAIAQAIHHPDLPQDDTPVKHVLKFLGTDEVIPPDKNLASAGVVHGDELQLLVKTIPASLLENEVWQRFSGPGFGHRGGSTFLLRGNSIIIGRIDHSTGVLSRVLGVDLTGLEDDDDHSVSRRHAQLLYRDGEYVLQDLKSTNGTRVNGRPLSPGSRVALRHADEVQFGDIHLFFLWDGQENG